MVLFSQFVTAPCTKNLFLISTIRADMRRHVFHYTNYRNLNFIKQFNAFGGIQQGNILWCGNNDRACHRNALRQG